jgi:hypothetical protein
MILFDNMYYLLYNYFKRTNSGGFGFKLTSTTLTGIYLYICLCILYCIAIIIYSLFLANEAAQTNIDSYNLLLSFVNGDVFVTGCVLSVICINIRYYTFKNINEIYKKKNDMDINKRERLDSITVFYMVASPFLLFFFANYVRDMYK